MPVRRHRWQYGSRHTFQFGPLLNSGLFSSHWLENRLCLEPEWRELKDEAKECLSRLADLWRVQKTRVALYGDEDTLRRSFIDPVLDAIVWKLTPEPLACGPAAYQAAHLTCWCGRVRCKLLDNVPGW